MRVLFISEGGETLGLASKIVSEGHVVDFYKARGSMLSGKGRFNSVESWRGALSKADLIVNSGICSGSLGHVLDGVSIPIIGFDNVLNGINHDTFLMYKALTAVGVDVGGSFMGSDRALLEKTLENFGGGFDALFKSPGKATFGFSSRSVEGFQYALGQAWHVDNILFQPIKAGVTVWTEGWWNGRDWVRPFLHSFQDFSRDFVIAGKRENKLTKETVLRLSKALKKTSFRGPISIKAVANEEGIFARGIYIGIRPESIYAMIEGLRTPIADLLYEVATGMKQFMNMSMEFMVSSNLISAPYILGSPISGLNENNSRHVCLMDSYTEEGEAKVCGPMVLRATARGEDLREATRRVIKTLGNIDVVNKCTNIVPEARVNNSIDLLRKWRYL